MALYGVWFKGRRTPIIVSVKTASQAVAAARKKKKRGGNEVSSVRKLNDSEKKTATKGRWVRTGPKGEPAGKSNLRGYGPKPKKKSS